MAYGTAALTSAMNKSLYFKDIFRKPNGNNFTIGSFDNCGFYKVTILSELTTVIIEFSQGRIISAQSISSNTNILTDQKYSVKLTEYEFNSNSSQLNIFGLVNEGDANFSVNIEYAGGTFNLSPSVSNAEISGTDYEKNNYTFKEFSFNSTEYTINIITNDVSSGALSADVLQTESVQIKTLQLGDWNIKTNDTGDITISINS